MIPSTGTKVWVLMSWETVCGLDVKGSVSSPSGLLMILEVFFLRYAEGEKK